MKRKLLFVFACFCSAHAVAQNLQSVTTTGNTTDRWLQITGANGVLSTGAGLELYGNSSTANGYIKAFNRATGVAGTLRIQDSGGNTYINETTGNVGIGTVDAQAKLDVRGDFRVSTGYQDIRLVTGTNTSAYKLSIGLNDDGINFTNNSLARNFNFNNANGNQFTISYAGNVGIATTTPMSGTNNWGMQVNRGEHSTIILGNPTAGYGGFIQTSDSKRRIFIGANIYDDQATSWKVMQSGKGVAGISIIADEGSYGTVIDFITNTADSYSKSMSILGNGSVGIGTQTTGTHKLAVEGSIGARKVKVQQSGWADFVFDADYKMPALHELEHFIKENKHLPEIPTTAEVEREGLDLGEMNKKLLQKVEELTLYIIQLQKNSDAQLKMIQDLQQNTFKK